jgi:hypothetical protein
MRLNTHIQKQKEKTTELTGIIKILKRDCKPFLNEIKSVGELLYRGTDISSENSIIKKTSRGKDRKPRDMPLEVHKIFNALFKKKFGWSPRQGVFATTSETIALKYSSPYLFFPIGSYKYLYSNDVTDLYEFLDDETWILPLFDGDNQWKSSYHTDRYEIQYGRDKKGEWFYNGEPTGEKDMSNAIKKLGLKDKDMNYNKFKWVPDRTFDEYIKDKKKEAIEVFKTAINTYKSTNLKNVDNESEISFNCSKYYLVDIYFYDDLRNEFI